MNRNTSNNGNNLAITIMVIIVMVTTIVTPVTSFHKRSAEILAGYFSISCPLPMTCQIFTGLHRSLELRGLKLWCSTSTLRAYERSGGGGVQNREPWKRQSKQAKHGGKEREDGRVGKPQREQEEFHFTSFSPEVHTDLKPFL